MKKTPQRLRQDAAHLRKLAGDMIAKAEQFELDAQRLEEEQEAAEEAKKELVALYFAWSRRVRMAH